MQKHNCLNQYNNRTNSAKICIFCGNSYQNKKIRFYTNNYQTKYWVCTSCIALLNGSRKVFEALEKLPLSVQKLHSSKKLNPIPHNCNPEGGKK